MNDFHDEHPARPRVVGFDLDLTLVDTRARILHSTMAAFADFDVPMEESRIVPHLGIPLADKVAALAPHLQAAPFVAAYRDHYHRDGAPYAPATPGALEALEAIHALGDRSVVVTAKVEWMGRDALADAGLLPRLDAVHGDLFAAQKSGALREEGAWVYVGDHPGDMQAAHGAGAIAVGVTTGANDEAALRRAGADVVLASLQEFRAWYAARRLSRPDAGPTPALRRCAAARA